MTYRPTAYVVCTFNVVKGIPVFERAGIYSQSAKQLKAKWRLNRLLQ